MDVGVLGVSHYAPAELTAAVTAQPRESLAARRAEWQPSAATPERGYYKLYVDHVLQADQGADFADDGVLLGEGRGKWN